MQLQIQMQVIVQFKVGDVTVKSWRNVPTNSRVAYGIIPSPGSVIEGPLIMNMHQIKRFAILVCNIQAIQPLLRVKYIRAYYEKTTNWQGEWLLLICKFINFILFIQTIS